MFDVTDGQILIDGKDIKTHNIKIIRDRISVVPQDVFLFSDSIAGNISFGNPNATIEQIKEYAAYASIHNEIENLPRQYETLVGERGVTLSGGQKQRISIARAFIKKPDVIILDDALSAVDTTTEQNILNYFDQAIKDKTAIIITHRANNLLNYDKILVLDEGKIVEDGTHETLITKDGFYASVYQQQSMQTA
jgi:ATP-binding cassette subfamily B protein